MSDRVLLDSDVVIDHLRGLPAAVSYIGGLKTQPFTSAVVVGELYSGVRDGPERAKLETFLSGLLILAADHAIGVEGGLLRREFGKSHGTGLPDALIAATVKLHSLTLITLNVKHFPMLTEIHVPYTKP